MPPENPELTCPKQPENELYCHMCDHPCTLEKRKPTPTTYHCNLPDEPTCFGLPNTEFYSEFWELAITDAQGNITPNIPDELRNVLLDQLHMGEVAEGIYEMPEAIAKTHLPKDKAGAMIRSKVVIQA